ncbi:hypothetical protein OG349_01515 [Streptomyces sp. NBC_01317]|uniref:hypothetical protein n=1 Tax=Streptomyces sp. NBC_01317 TaxID=2903822 RepID=UPI002E0F218E|nr:hypothetical protein OG349_01515 [Streptomyces sp. NBC_01317]
MTMQQVRQDRILYEAREREDPLPLMRLFGVSDGTATRYIAAARPGTDMRENVPLTARVHSQTRSDGGTFW